MKKEAVLNAVGPVKGGSHNRATGKWAASIDDVTVPMPQRRVPVALAKELASVPSDYVLVRDHNSPNDVVFDDGDMIDLAEGNVFYRLKRCEVTGRGACQEIAKRAWFLNDVSEITIRPELSGETLRSLFSLSTHSDVLRDVDGTHDVPIAIDATALFEDGPVFISREVHAELKITVSSRIFSEAQGVKSRMTGLEIAALVYPDKPGDTRVWFVSDGNREVALDETVCIKGCEVFDVVRKEVTGGFERSRIDREIDLLASSGQRVTVLTGPDVVIFHDLRTHPGRNFGTTDVLVPVPGGYPAQMLDLAYLRTDSPLIGKVKGQPQEVLTTALGCTWRQISYHPHNGGGGPAWDPTVHGFHTYVVEVMSWLHDLQ
ncbi:E2/UBC family protein [Lacipirellula parvula]|uniref:Multi-ubiquitin domain-containing protein n=1 Tax=Lacipirellula parvula TaxID=2650471 RepID=A0A5K7XCS2_9BACT|nr:E2/UBC family protein [Lacipirellula parvula]BBO34175.1 hypothetical protein PLANPX_3787 [Lacipirellula parvula]